MINQFLLQFGIDGPSWISHPDYALSTLVVLAVWQFGSPMVIFLAGLKQIPSEIYEAAAIDGAGPFRIYWSVILPLLSPALFSFIWTYEDFLTPLVYLTSMENYTVPQGLRLFMSSTGVSSWGPMLAMSLLSLAPLFIVFFIFQQRIIEGIAASGMKG